MEERKLVLYHSDGCDGSCSTDSLSFDFAQTDTGKVAFGSESLEVLNELFDGSAVSAAVILA